MPSNVAEATLTWWGLSPNDWASIILGTLAFLLSVLSFFRSSRSERRADAADSRSIETAKAQKEAALRQKLFGLLVQAHDVRAKVQASINSYRLAAGTLSNPPEGFSESSGQMLLQANEALTLLQGQIAELEDKIKTMELRDEDALIDVRSLEIGRFYAMAEDLFLQTQTVHDADALRRAQRALLGASAAEGKASGT